MGNNYNNYQPPNHVSNIKIYCYLAYIPFLWLVGLFVPEKDDAEVRFHVGQGIILTIVAFILNAVVTVVANILYVVLGLFIWSSFLASLLQIIRIIPTIIVIIYIIIGCLNVRNNVLRPLPIIGQFAFYR